MDILFYESLILRIVIIILLYSGIKIIDNLEIVQST